MFFAQRFINTVEPSDVMMRLIDFLPNFFDLKLSDVLIDDLPPLFVLFRRHELALKVENSIATIGRLNFPVLK